ncbi:MAG: 5'/3'-nucleotidase SurE [Myxococcales bacterium]|nr:5'/3'-nucleotidase SurE [Myxococcales bacterium]
MTERPLILVSNDDGYYADGIQQIAAALEEIGEVWVVAPERERSATSHAITLHKPLRVKKVAERRFWVSGTPTDCVYVGVNHILPRPAALMVSGINAGANLGDDVTYSGTVGAAMEATLLEIPSIAASLTDIGESADYAGAIKLVVDLARSVLANGLPDHVLLNINVPSGYDVSRGLRATRLGRRHYGREVEERADPRGRRYLWIGGAKPVFIDTPGSDCNAAEEGIASVTPVIVDTTAAAVVETIAGWPGIHC